MEVEFDLRPLRLSVKKTERQRSRYVILQQVDAVVYRRVARAVIVRLLEENAALRRSPQRPPTQFAVVLAWALRRALESRSRP